MQVRIRGILLGLIAAGGGIGLAILMGASAGAAGPTTTTLGNATSTPSPTNICSGGINCTYLPFDPVSKPELQVPFDGAVTSFSVSSGSATGSVHLRVLRPADNGQFTGAGTSPAEPLSAGTNTFTLSPGLPVKAGDVLALDNDSSALIFDSSSQTAVAGYYELPALADGATAAPNHRADARLMMSAVVQSNGTTTTTATNGTTTVIVTKTVTTPTGARPILTNLKQSHRAWREANLPRKKNPPVGTTLSFKLNARALVTFTFRQRQGRRTKLRGRLSLLGHAGINRVKFKGVVSTGKALPTGRYTVTVVAGTQSGQSKPASLQFTIAI